jgi:hypothetical protein
MDADWLKQEYTVGSPLIRSMQLWFAAIVLLAMAAAFLIPSSVSAFRLASGGTGDNDNSAFADPHEQVNIFGFDQGPQPSGLSGPVQTGSQQSRVNAFKRRPLEANLINPFF